MRVFIYPANLQPGEVDRRAEIVVRIAMPLDEEQRVIQDADEVVSDWFIGTGLSTVQDAVEACGSSNEQFNTTVQKCIEWALTNASAMNDAIAIEDGVPDYGNSQELRSSLLAFISG